MTMLNMLPAFSIYHTLIFIFYFFNFSWHSILFYTSFQHRTEWIDNHTIYETIPPVFQVPTWHPACYYNIDCSPYAVLHIH